MDQWQDKVLTHDKPHARPENLDPKKNGPFLDDVRAEQERAYREARVKASKEQIKKQKEAEKAAAKKKAEPKKPTPAEVLNEIREDGQREFREAVENGSDGE